MYSVKQRRDLKALQAPAEFEKIEMKKLGSARGQLQRTSTLMASHLGRPPKETAEFADYRESPRLKTTVFWPGAAIGL